MIQDTIATGEEAMAKEVSVLERIRKLDEERAKLAEGAVAEALAEAQAAVDQLNMLGKSYELVDVSKPLKRTKTGAGVRKSPSGVCPTCDFTTDPPHDSRKHRSQGDNKKPFTKDELAELGLRRID